MAFLKTILIRKRGLLFKIVLAVPAVWVIMSLALMDRSPEKDPNAGAVKIRHDLRKTQQHIDRDGDGAPGAVAVGSKEARDSVIAQPDKLVNEHPRQEKLVDVDKPEEPPHEVSTNTRVRRNRWTSTNPRSHPMRSVRTPASGETAGRRRTRGATP